MDCYSAWETSVSEKQNYVVEVRRIVTEYTFGRLSAGNVGQAEANALDVARRTDDLNWDRLTQNDSDYGNLTAEIDIDEPTPPLIQQGCESKGRSLEKLMR